jgi:type I restriction enzyme S subunit
MSEWKEYKLGDVATFMYGRLPSKKLLGNGSYPIYSGYKYQDSYPEYNCEEEDVILVARGVGGTGDVKLTTQKCYLTNLSIRIDLDNSIILNKFFYYIYQKENLRYLDSGSAQSQITIQDLSNVYIEVPSIAQQKEIVSILSSLDDKIDLLNRENATLEAMAEALFRQWFIEEFKEDWEEKPLSSIATFLNGLACQKYPPKNDIDKLPVLKIRELTNGIGADSDWATTDVGEEYVVHSGDVVFAWSASLMVKIWDGGDCILNQHLFRVTSTTYPKWFYYLWCKHYLNEFIAIAQSHATTMGHIKRNDLDTAMVLVPSPDELKILSETMEPIFSKLKNNNYQLVSLRTQRDILLPKLMSNEIEL